MEPVDSDIPAQEPEVGRVRLKGDDILGIAGSKAGKKTLVSADVYNGARFYEIFGHFQTVGIYLTEDFSVHVSVIAGLDKEQQPMPAVE